MLLNRFINSALLVIRRAQDRAEVDRAAGELGTVEVDRAIGELRAGEVDLAAGELGAGEVDYAAGEVGEGEVTAVKDDPVKSKLRSCQDTAAPNWRWSVMTRTTVWWTSRACSTRS